MAQLQWVGLAIGGLTLVGLVVGAYFLGRKNKKTEIERDGLKDVNEHYQKMAENFNEVDRLVGNARDLLGVSGDGKRGPEVPATGD